MAILDKLFMSIDINIINRIAKKAGKRILEYYDNQIKVNRKSDGSPLTSADLNSHEIIVKELELNYPNVPILSEESEIPTYKIRKDWNEYFLIDPLDGTKEFIKRNGEFTVNIAYLIKNIPVLGVVYIPAKDLLYFATKSEGAFKQVGNQSTTKITHDVYDKQNPARIAVSRSHKNSDTVQRLAEYGISVREEVPSGSSLKFCLVAEGSVDLYPRFGPTMEWDTAAGDAIYRYSGKNGAISSPLTYNKESLLNPEFIIGL